MASIATTLIATAGLLQQPTEFHELVKSVNAVQTSWTAEVPMRFNDTADAAQLWYLVERSSKIFSPPRA